MNPLQFLDYVVRPALAYLDPDVPHTAQAEALLMATAAQESQFEYIAQLGGGPARGVYQCEPATHHDIIINFLAFRPALDGKVRGLASGDRYHTDPDQALYDNHAYATAICRVHYLRVSDPIPDVHADGLDALAAYYLRHYNAGGRATAQQFVDRYRRYVAGCF